MDILQRIQADRGFDVPGRRETQRTYQLCSGMRPLQATGPKVATRRPLPESTFIGDDVPSLHARPFDSVFLALPEPCTLFSRFSWVSRKRWSMALKRFTIDRIAPSFDRSLLPHNPTHKKHTATQTPQNHPRGPLTLHGAAGLPNVATHTAAAAFVAADNDT